MIIVIMLLLLLQCCYYFYYNFWAIYNCYLIQTILQVSLLLTFWFFNP